MEVMLEVGMVIAIHHMINMGLIRLVHRIQGEDQAELESTNIMMTMIQQCRQLKMAVPVLLL